MSKRRSPEMNNSRMSRNMKAKSVAYSKVKEGEKLSDMRLWIEKSLKKEKLDPCIIKSPKA